MRPTKRLNTLHVYIDTNSYPRFIKMRPRKSDRQYLKYRSLKPDTRHTNVSEVLVLHRLDVFKSLPATMAQIYRDGVAVAVMSGGPREKGKLPYQVHSIWINPGLHIQMIREDEDKPDRIIPRTRVNPGILLAQSLVSITLIDQLLFIDKQPSITVTRLKRPAIVILPPDAIDRVPSVTIALVRLHRDSGLTVEPGEMSIEDEIRMLAKGVG